MFDEFELRVVVDELCVYFIELVGKSGGYFVVGLGVIEFIVVLYYLYQILYDQLVWDVGYQIYLYKILIGCCDEIYIVKQKDGVVLFLKCEESEYDIFGVGYFFILILVVFGMVIVCQFEGDDCKIVVVIGDGVMIVGMVFEVLMYVGGMELELNLLVIFNDNNMLIFEVVGGLIKMLG